MALKGLCNTQMALEGLFNINLDDGIPAEQRRVDGKSFSFLFSIT
jgi:hypothetical protein